MYRFNRFGIFTATNKCSDSWRCRYYLASSFDSHRMHENDEVQVLLITKIL